MPGDIRFATVSVSDSHLCGITREPVTWCIGFPGDGEVGNGIRYGIEVDGVFTLTSFVRVERWTNLVSIAVGWGSSCAVNEPGTPICWGYWARIGMGNDTMRWIPAEQAQPQ